MLDTITGAKGASSVVINLPGHILGFSYLTEQCLCIRWVSARGRHLRAMQLVANKDDWIA